MTIFHCPSCRHKYMLKSKPGKTFTCPDCGYRAPFNIVLNAQNNISMKVTNTASTSDYSSQDKTKVALGMQDKTKIVESLTDKTIVDFDPVNDSFGEKTKLVESLQKPAERFLHVTFGNMKGNVKLPLSGQFTLGRNSSDSNAQIKLTPDSSMSRIHAGMRVISQQGKILYQVTSIKNSNPVVLNGIPIGKGQACTLKAGDMMQMGNTKLIFK